MGDLKFATHPLENCLFLSYRLSQKGDDPFETFCIEDRKYVVDGLLGLHVDDYLGCGEEVGSQKDIEIDPEAPINFATRLAMLKRRFRFGKWNFDYNMVFCGCEVEQSRNHATINVKLESYTHKIKPLSIEKERRNTPP